METVQTEVITRNKTWSRMAISHTGLWPRQLCLLVSNTEECILATLWKQRAFESTLCGERRCLALRIHRLPLEESLARGNACIVVLKLKVIRTSGVEIHPRYLTKERIKTKSRPAAILASVLAWRSYLLMLFCGWPRCFSNYSPSSFRLEGRVFLPPRTNPHS